MKKIKVSEKQKLLCLVVITVLTLLCFIVFLFKLPSTSDFISDQIPEKWDKVILKDGDVYEQTFVGSVDDLSIVATLLLRDQEVDVAGRVFLEVYDQKNKMLSKGYYTSNHIPSIDYVKIVLEIQPNSKDTTYKIKVYSKGIGESNGLRIGLLPSKKNQVYINGVKQNSSLFISQMGKKGDIIYYWYIFMILAMLLPLYALIDYSKIVKGENHEKK